jgi:hypothetical protein
MRTEKRLISVQSMILVFCPLLLLTSNAHTQTRRKIEGLVSDKDNIKIPAVLVRVYRGKEKLGEDRTKADGSYTVTFDNENHITTIRYDHSDWNPTVIRHVSGTRDNTINKVLSRAGDPLSSDEQRDLASTLERLYAIDRANGVSDVEFRAAYGETIYKAKLPSELLTWLPPDRDRRDFRELFEPVEDPIKGVWAGTAIRSGPGFFPSRTSVSFTLNLDRRGNTVVGTVIFPEGSIPIKRGSFERDRINLELNTPQGPVRMTGRVQSGRIEGGRIEGGQSEMGRWSAVKKPGKD